TADCRAVRMLLVPVGMLVDREPGRRDAGPQHALGVHVRIAERQRAQRPLQLLERQAGIEQRAERQPRGPHHAMLRSEQDDAELFEPTRAEPRQQILGRLAWLAKLQPLARRAAEAAATQLERGQNLRRPRLADAGHAHQLVDRAPAQPAEAAERGQHGVADAERAAAPRSAADDHREQFVVAERRRPAIPQLLSRPVARQQVLHLTLFVRGSSGWSSAARYTGSCPRGVAACCPPPSSRRCWARRAAILPTRKCNRRRRRSRPRAPPAPTSSREKSSPPPKTPSNAPTKPSRS